MRKEEIEMNNKVYELGLTVCECPSCHNLKAVELFREKGKYISICKACVNDGVSNNFHNEGVYAYAKRNKGKYKSKNKVKVDSIYETDHEDSVYVRALIKCINTHLKAKKTKSYYIYEVVKELNQVIFNKSSITNNTLLRLIKLSIECESVLFKLEFITPNNKRASFDQTLIDMKASEIKGRIRAIHHEERESNELTTAEKREQFTAYKESNEYRFYRALFNKCRYCNDRFDNPDVVSSADHYIPLSKGGRITIDNISFCCETCNQKKGNIVLPYLKNDKLQKLLFA